MPLLGFAKITARKTRMPQIGPLGSLSATALVGIGLAQESVGLQRFLIQGFGLVKLLGRIVQVTELRQNIGNERCLIKLAG